MYRMQKNSLVNLYGFLLHKSSGFFWSYYKSRSLKGRETDQISVRFWSHIQSGSSCQNRRPQPNNGAKNHLRCTTKLLLSPGTLLLGTTRSVSDHLNFSTNLWSIMAYPRKQISWNYSLVFLILYKIEENVYAFN